MADERGRGGVAQFSQILGGLSQLGEGIDRGAADLQSTIGRRSAATVCKEGAPTAPLTVAMQEPLCSSFPPLWRITDERASTPPIAVCLLRLLAADCMLFFRHA